MLKRLITAVVLVLIIATGFLEKTLEFIPVCLIAILGLISIRELALMFANAGINVSKRVSTLIVGMLILVAWFRWMEMAFPVVGLVVILGFLWRMFRDPIKGSWTDISVTCGTALYIGVPIALMIDLFLQGFEGKIWLGFMLLTIWSTDIGAFFSGKMYGKKKLYPRLSPAKTVEGAIGGVFAAFIPLLLFMVGFPETMNQFSPLILVLLSVFMAVLIIIGDMAESLLKREAGVKDSGYALAGHGGALDRVDSMLFVCVPFILFLRLMHPGLFAN